MQRLDRAKWIGTGAKSTERVVYVFTDPDCPFCNDLWKAMQKARAPDVQIRYLLVAVIDADSKGKDAAILEAKDPVAALEKSERNFDHGGIAPKSAALPRNHRDDFIQWGFDGRLAHLWHPRVGLPG